MTDSIGCTWAEIPEKIERSFVGCLLVAPEYIPRMRELVRPDDLSVDNLRLVYEALLLVIDDGCMVDLLNVCDKLDKRGYLNEALSPGFIVDLVNNVDTSKLDVYLPRAARRMVRSAAISDYYISHRCKECHDASL